MMDNANYAAKLVAGGRCGISNWCKRPSSVVLRHRLGSRQLLSGTADSGGVNARTR